MQRFLLLLILLLLTQPLLAFEGRYRVEGQSSKGAYHGRASISAGSGAGYRVSLRLTVADGAEQTLAADVSRVGAALEWSTPHHSARFERDGGGLLVRWRDSAGRLARVERWYPEVEIEVALAAITAHGGMPGIDAAEAKQAQLEVLARLAEVYAPLGMRFHPVRSQPLLLAGADCDLDRDARLTRDEVEAVRDRLERIGYKRPGRVVITLTRAPFVGHGARGWTLGDAAQTPATLEDLNDNFSLIGFDYVGSGHHTVAHEVGHQFGLDDLGDENLHALRQPGRDDHLMQSGGEGVQVDPAVAGRLLRWVRFADRGLRGRRVVRPAEWVPASAPSGAEGLGAPPAAFRR